MTTFDERELAFEKKFAHDEELSFKINARRNKLLGLWAAGLMGKNTEEASAYAKEVVLAEYEEAGDQDVFRKIAADLSAAGIGISDNELRGRMNALLDEARMQMMKE